MLNENKIRHIVQVAQETRYWLDKVLPKEDRHREEKLDAAFVMGLLHDIGYDKLDEDDNPTRHAEISAEMATHFVAHADELVAAIKNHGHDECESLFAYALNKADLTVDSHGGMVDMLERVEKIERDYPGTTHAAHARQQYEYVLTAERRLTNKKAEAGKTRSYRAVDFDSFSTACPWAFCHGEGHVNNGYNCSHPNQEETEDDSGYTTIGRCHCFSCPLGTMAEACDLGQDPDDPDAIRGDIDWSGVDCGADGKPSVDTLDEEDTLLVRSDMGKDTDQSEALFWWESYLNRYNADWKREHQADTDFYNKCEIRKRIPIKKEDRHRKENAHGKGDAHD